MLYGAQQQQQKQQFRGPPSVSVAYSAKLSPSLNRSNISCSRSSSGNTSRCRPIRAAVSRTMPTRGRLSVRPITCFGWPVESWPFRAAAYPDTPPVFQLSSPGDCQHFRMAQLKTLHSPRSACAGLMDAALHAGLHAAISPTEQTKLTTPASITGLPTVTP
jgi:hypothetical protein